jgi:hypothetical protein
MKPEFLNVTISDKLMTGTDCAYGHLLVLSHGGSLVL